MSRGNDQFINPDAVASGRSTKALVVPRGGELVDLVLVNASVASAAKAVLGDALDQQYTISDKVSGTITIQSTRPIEKAALLDLFEAALSANGARLERVGDALQIVPGTSGNRAFRLAQDGVADGSSVIVAPLEYISASQMIRLLEPLSSEGLTAIADKKRNLLLLSGEPGQLEAALDALNLFDVDVLRGKSIALVELNSADPEAIVSELQLIFETEEGGMLEGGVEVVPNKRLGSVLVITSRADYLPRAQKWIRELDRSASGAGRYIATYELDNRAASDVAPILKDLLIEASQSDSQGLGETPAEAALVGGSRVAADEARNALIVRATRREHRQVKSLLNEIDASPRQVLLEATIAEVRLNDEVGLGVRWFFESGKFDFTFSDVASGATGSTFPGFSAVFGSGTAAAAINALASVTDVEIISSPTLMVLDDQEAVLQIGDQVPVATQSTTDVLSPDAPTVTQIEYRDTGVILTVKPNINRNGRVVLDVIQEISSVSENVTSGIDSPTFQQRRVATNVLLNDGATLALGGLVEERDSITETKVPGLGDVPFVGSVFRNRESVKRRSELLILIRPRVVMTEHESQTITEYWRNKLSGSDSILSTGLGGASHQVNEILR